MLFLHKNASFWFSIKSCFLKRLVMKHKILLVKKQKNNKILCSITNRFNKHNFIENQKKLHFWHAWMQPYRNRVTNFRAQSNPTLIIFRVYNTNNLVHSIWNRILAFQVDPLWKMHKLILKMDYFRINNSYSIHVRPTFWPQNYEELQSTQSFVAGNLQVSILAYLNAAVG
jgi:hypothetical protein